MTHATMSPALSRAALVSEWTKLRSLRSTHLNVLGAVLLSLAVCAMVANSTVTHWDTASAAAKATFDPVGESFNGMNYAWLIFGSLGVLAMSSEHTTGMIRTTFAAVPRRRTVLNAKIVVVGGVTLVVGMSCAFASYFLGQAVFARKHLDVGLGDHNVLRAVTGAGFSLVCVTLFGLGLGAIIRHTAGAIAVLFGLAYLLPGITHGLIRWSYTPSKWTLSRAGESLSTTLPQGAENPSPGMGVVVQLTYVVVTLAIASFLITRRDA
ncbi:ABC transporter permease [Embleya sp. AB8]|uniref:ABC transporter permease n=1 Tax=Embleya sp. AB8 TaxID=3156304 RepID=UPI003C76F307